MVKKNQILIQIISCVLFCSGCNVYMDYLYKTNSASDKMTYGCIYMTSRYTKEYDLNMPPPRRVLDSTLGHRCLIFFRNGTFRWFGIHESQRNDTFIKHYLDSQRNQKDHWGVFEMRGDTLHMIGWSGGWGHENFEKIGTIIDKDSIVIYNTRMYSRKKFEIKSSTPSAIERFSSHPLNVFADSTFEFIKPISDKKGK